MKMRDGACEVGRRCFASHEALDAIAVLISAMRFVTTELATDIVITIGDVKFYCHKMLPTMNPSFVVPCSKYPSSVLLQNQLLSRILYFYRLCEGDELLDRILAKKNSRYIEKDAAVVVRQMLKVAAECHLCGLVHQDMKPENLLFKSNKEDSPLKAIDFGLSDFIKLGKKFHDIIGSAYYVAPEILKQRSGPEPDVWSIGVITYILLCGRRPFWDKTEDGIFKEMAHQQPTPSVYQNREVPQVVTGTLCLEVGNQNHLLGVGTNVFI
uniref:Calcium dependent protein kinase n=1 Tax=Saccharum hybrid cultivar R570 TaxID=131158 RepID=A0A059PZS9_9POAL|nr:calcium dependent protein kinase [Saccharum hybrid cultivar R570]